MPDGVTSVHQLQQNAAKTWKRALLTTGAFNQPLQQIASSLDE